MNRFEAELQAELAGLDAAVLLRNLRTVSEGGRVVGVDGRPLINLASNDYLGLARHPKLKSAAIGAIEKFGVGGGASRLVTGHHESHAKLELRFAAFKHAEAALLFPTGYMANLAVLTTLVGPDDLVLLDKLCHASLIDAARASGATMRTFPHLDYERLEKLIKRHRSEVRSQKSEIFLATDSVFSMDGDVADLPILCELARRYGAVTIVDEAHGTGVLGETGAGLCEAQGVTGRVDIVISTASKALGGLGGLVTASRVVIDTLINKARPFIYTTAAPPAQAATITAALDVLRDEPWRRHRLADLSRQVREKLPDAGFEGAVNRESKIISPIIPLIVGEPTDALALAEHLRASGILAVAIRPPTVPPGASRVRISLRTDLEDANVDCLLDALCRWRLAV